MLLLSVAINNLLLILNLFWSVKIKAYLTNITIILSKYMCCIYVDFSYSKLITLHCMPSSAPSHLEIVDKVGGTILIKTLYNTIYASNILYLQYLLLVEYRLLLSRWLATLHVTLHNDYANIYTAQSSPNIRPNKYRTFVIPTFCPPSRRFNPIYVTFYLKSQTRGGFMLGFNA